MSNMMGVFLDGSAQLEYNRDQLLPDHQAAYLDKMDSKMDEGIVVGSEKVENPDLNQRAQFAAANLLHALNTDDESMAAAMCSYLAIRLPDLKQVRFEAANGEVSIELIYDEEYRKQVAVEFSGLH